MNVQKVKGAETKIGYSHENPIKLLTISIESSLCDYSDAYILVTGNIDVVRADDNTKVALKNCAPFRKCTTEIKNSYWWSRTSLILQRLCTIWLDTVIVILILHEVYSPLKEMK